MLTTTNSVNKLFCYDMMSYSQGNRFRRLRLFQSFQVVLSTLAKNGITDIVSKFRSDPCNSDFTCNIHMTSKSQCKFTLRTHSLMM